MDLQKMLSKISPEQLEQGMKQLGLTPEQKKQVNNMVDNKGGAPSNLNMDDVNEFLKNNPNLAKQAQQANMMNMISDIFKK